MAHSDEDDDQELDSFSEILSLHEETGNPGPSNDASPEDTFEAPGANSVASQANGNRQVRGLIEVLEEVSPLFHATPIDGHVVTQLSSLTDDLYALTKTISERLNLTADNLLDRYLVRRLALKLAQLLPAFGPGNLQADAIVAMMEYAKGVADPDTDGLDLISADTQPDELLIKIRLALLGPSLRLQHMLTHAGLPEATRHEALSWLNQRSVSLAQDLAINANPSAGLHDRELLFANVLEDCGTLCMEAWTEVFRSSLPAPLNSLDESSIWASCPMLQSAVENQSMGHDDHPDYSMGKLRTGLSGFLKGKLEGATWEALPPAVRDSCRAKALAALESLCAYAWNDAANSLLDRVSQMSEEQFESWSQRPEAQEPMPLSDVVARFEAANDGLSLLWSDFAVDYEALDHKTSESLATLWGFSAAVCEMKES